MINLEDIAKLMCILGALGIALSFMNTQYNELSLLIGIGLFVFGMYETRKIT